MRIFSVHSRVALKITNFIYHIYFLHFMFFA
jgi:hypothetical protein